MPNLSNTVTFLFAGDGSLASDGLSALLQTKSSFLLVAECRDGQSAVENIAAHGPEIAVIDAQLPDMSALAIVEQVRSGHAATKLIILGASPDRAEADQLLAAGADAFVVRSGPSRHLNEAIRYVRDGGKYLAPQLTQEHPVTSGQAENSRAEADSAAILELRQLVETQSQTVMRLESSMERAHYAIEILQQKIEQITGTQIEVPSAPATASEPQAAPAPEQPAPDQKDSRFRLPSFKTGAAAAAALFVVGTLGFQLAGILKPAHAATGEEPAAEFVGSGVEDALNPASNSALHLPDWQNQMLEQSVSLFKNQKFAAAETICRRLLRENPANTPAARILASALYHQNRIEESADVIRTMVNPQGRTEQAARPPAKISFLELTSARPAGLFP